MGRDGIAILLFLSHLRTRASKNLPSHALLELFCASLVEVFAWEGKVGERS